MGFIDKYKDELKEEFMNLPETEDDIPEEEDFDISSLLPTKEELKSKLMESYDLKLDIFIRLERKLIDLGYDDKSERYRIIEMIM